MPSIFISESSVIVSIIVFISLYKNPYLPNPVSIFMCALILLSVSLLKLLTILAHSSDPIVIIISLSTRAFKSSFMLVDDIISISSLIPSFLNCKASSTVATARVDIPLSIKNFEYSTSPSPYPFPLTTPINLYSLPLSAGISSFAKSFITFILCLKSSLLITSAFICFLFSFYFSY